jgi:uncharacterized protein YoxC
LFSKRRHLFPDRQAAALRKIKVGARMNNETLLVVFVGLTGLALMVQALVMVIGLVTVRKAIARIQEDVSELRTAAMPVIAKSRETLDRVAPRIESISKDMAELAHTLREQGVELQATASEVLERVQRQTSRVDSMFTSVADGVEHASNVVADTVTRPVRQAAAVVASAKAFFSVLATGKRPTRPANASIDQDMFV